MWTVQRNQSNSKQMMSLPAQKDTHEATQTTSQFSNVICHKNEAYDLEILC